MSDMETPPPVLVPPVLGQTETPAPPPEERPAPTESSFEKRLKKMGPIGVTLAALLAKLKSFMYFLFVVAKFAKFGKVGVMLLSMIVSIGAYSMIFGFKFGLAFVLLIFVHEMGHVFVAWQQGTPITAPLFIPFCGAIIFGKRGSNSAWAQAIMGIGGPVAGGLGGLVCLGLYFATHNFLFLGLASVSFFMNLFNLMPIVPLDGGWIVGAVSPWLWLVGLVGLLVMTFTGHMLNPMVWVLVLTSLPRVWTLFDRRKGQVAGVLLPPTPPQRAIMFVCYFSLAASLMLGLRYSHETMSEWIDSQPRHSASPVAFHGGLVRGDSWLPPSSTAKNKAD